MIKYLLHPFIFLVKELWGFLVALLLAFRGPLLFLLAYFLISLLIAIPAAIIFYHYEAGIVGWMKVVRHVEEYIIPYALSLLFIFLFIWRLLERVVPDGRNIPKASSSKLSRGTASPLIQKSLQDTFVWKTSQRRKAIMVSSPCQGIYVEGSAGAGKSQSVVEPILYQAAEQGYAGFLYDFKGHPPTLSSHLYGALSKYKSGIHFAHINLADPGISHRCNPLSPAYLRYS